LLVLAQVEVLGDVACPQLVGPPCDLLVAVVTVDDDVRHAGVGREQAAEDRQGGLDDVGARG
jgi:hypothetical protein